MRRSLVLDNMALAGNLRERRMLVGIAENNKTVQRRIIDEVIN